jgi:hypothetical protein
MRKIEQAMLDAVKHRRYWHSHNTQVIPELRQDGKPLARVLLNLRHFATVGYRPASVDDPISHWYAVDNLSVSLAGWNTPMMRSRIRALLSLYPGYIIYTQYGSCYILDRNTGRKNMFIRNTEWISIPFLPE